MTKLHLVVKLCCVALVIVDYLFIAITPRSTLTQMMIAIRVPSMGQIDLFANY